MRTYEVASSSLFSPCCRFFPKVMGFESALASSERSEVENGDLCNQKLKGTLSTSIICMSHVCESCKKASFQRMQKCQLTTLQVVHYSVQCHAAAFS